MFEGLANGTLGNIAIDALNISNGRCVNELGRLELHMHLQ